MINLIWIIFIIFLIILAYSYFIKSGLPKGSKVSLTLLNKFLLKPHSKLNKLYKNENNIYICLHIKYLSYYFIIDLLIAVVMLVCIVLACIFTFTDQFLYSVFSLINVGIIAISVLLNIYFLIHHEINSKKCYEIDTKLSDLDKDNIKKDILEIYPNIFDK